jgi:hypothetical protein
VVEELVERGLPSIQPVAEVHDGVDDFEEKDTEQLGRGQ